MREWLLILSPLALTLYFAVNQDQFAGLLGWLTQVLWWWIKTNCRFTRACANHPSGCPLVIAILCCFRSVSSAAPSIAR